MNSGFGQKKANSFLNSRISSIFTMCRKKACRGFSEQRGTNICIHLPNFM